MNKMNWYMGKFLNSRRWVGDLILFEALAGGAFDHLQIYKLPTHWGIGTKFFIQVKCWEGGRRRWHGRFLNWPAHYPGLLAIITFQRNMTNAFQIPCWKGGGGGGIGHARNRPYNILDTRHLCEHFRIDWDKSDVMCYFWGQTSGKICQYIIG